MRSILASVLISLAACGGGGDSGPTGRELAEEAGAAICTRARECVGATDPEYQDCIDEFVDGVCAVRDCDAEAENVAQIEDCIEAAPSIDCATGELPAECEGAF